MVLYILKDNYERDILVDRFKSFIWTERFSATGDFELVISSTAENRARFAEGTYLGRDNSVRIMVVETVEDSDDEEGRAMLTVTGRSLEAILEERAAMNSLGSLDTTPKWSLMGVPGDIARQVFEKICVDGILSPEDIIPQFGPGSYFPADTIPETADVITREFEPSSVYSVVKSVCDEFELGFRLYLNPDTQELNFDVYSGNDRTSAQSSVAAVVFSQALDNLSNVTELKSHAGFKNVAYVFGKVGSTIVYSHEDEANLRGVERRVLVVVDNDIEETDPVLLEELLQNKGKEELAKHRKVYAFDGEIPQNSDYKYNVDYILGDMVEMRNTDGAAKNMRVAEQIFVIDEQGERSYPTLTDVLLITPGTWLSWDYAQEWVDADGYWADA